MWTEALSGPIRQGATPGRSRKGEPSRRQTLGAIVVCGALAGGRSRCDEAALRSAVVEKAVGQLRDRFRQDAARLAAFRDVEFKAWRVDRICSGLYPLAGRRTGRARLL